MKIPKKKELLRLQAKHHTDTKIGEALGGVSGQLVSYWRKKKKVPAWDLPKYGLGQIKSLWETWGSDREAGAQLGISPAAFYKWRQRYGIKQRPRQLKFSQLQLNLFTESKTHRSNSFQTLVEKVAGFKLDRKIAFAGERYQLDPDLVVLSSDWEQLLEECQNIGLKRVKRPDRVWAVLPGLGPSQGCPTELSKKIKEFLKQNQIKNVFSQKEGDFLQVLWEKSVIPPLGLAVGTERPIKAVGFLGCWGQPADNFSVAHLLECGKISLEIPSTVKVCLNGQISPAIFAADIYSFLTKQLEPALIRDKLLEFTGDALSQLSLGQRMSLARLWTQAPVWGVLLAVDQAVRKNLLSRLKKSVPLTKGDDQAAYAEKLEFDLSLLEPLVTFAPPLNKITSVRQQKRKMVFQIVLGAGSHGRLEELEIASRILANRKIHPEVKLLVMPSSRKIFLSALKKGYVRTLLEAGGIICDPGIGDWKRLLDSGSPILTTCRLNCNHPDFFQSPEIIFANPATAAASALKGEITDPRDYL